MKLLQTYFWKRLPIGDLISLAPISLAFSKSSSNHLKINMHTSAHERLHGHTYTPAQIQHVQTNTHTHLITHPQTYRPVGPGVFRTIWNTRMWWVGNKHTPWWQWRFLCRWLGVKILTRCQEWTGLYSWCSPLGVMLNLTPAQQNFWRQRQKMCLCKNSYWWFFCVSLHCWRAHAWRVVVGWTNILQCTEGNFALVLWGPSQNQPKNVLRFLKNGNEFTGGKCNRDLCAQNITA